jgi:hypothetical protein
MINYLIGDATLPIKHPSIICHIVNDENKWGAGFVIALSNRFGGRGVPGSPEYCYRNWASGNYDSPPFELGQVQFVKIPDTEGLWVANMLAQHGISDRNVTGVIDKDCKPPIRYDALAKCLETVNRIALSFKASLHMPRIGCGLAGGSWPIVEGIIKVEVTSEVYVYDLKG